MEDDLLSTISDKLSITRKSTLQQSTGIDTLSEDINNLDLLSKDVKHEVLIKKAFMNMKPESIGACRDYKIMVHEETEFKSLPPWDSSEQCTTQNLIETTENKANASKLLKKKFMERLVTRIELDNEIEALREEQMAFGDSFVNYDKFVKDNADKRDRALEKIKLEKTIQANLNEQIGLSEAKIERLMQIKGDMLRSIDDRKVFVDYLEEARAMAPTQYRNDIHEVVERYELLLKIQEDLENEQEEMVNQTHELGNKMFQVTTERTVELINLRNKVTELKYRYDIAKNASRNWENLANDFEQTTSEQSIEFLRIKSSCYNLYLQICEHHGLPVEYEKHQVQEQLGVIENTIMLLRKTLELVKKTTGFNKRSNSISVRMLARAPSF